jgi:hypothetical protein
MADDLSNRNYFKAGWDFRDGQRLSLAPSSFARSPIGSPYGLLSHPGELRVYHVPSEQQSAVGLAYTPVMRRPRP